MSRLDKAMSTLDSNGDEFDSDNEVKLNPDNAEAEDAISTGSVVVNYMIGGNRLSNGDRQCPGIPRGRITEIFGEEGTGKCLTKDTYVQSEYGMLTIGEIFDRMGSPAVTTSKTEAQEVRLLNERGEQESTSHFTWNNRRTVYHVENDLGLSVSATSNHPLRILNRDGFVVWKNAADIEEGDQLVVMKGSESFPSDCGLTSEEARWVGYMVSDGSLTQKNKMMFSNSNPDVIRDFKQLSESLFEGVEVRSYEKGEVNTIDHHINSKHLRQVAEAEYGMGYGTAADKYVPQKVRQGTREIQESFLRAYFELESHVNVDRREITVTSASEELLDQIQLMLLNMGYLSTRDIKEIKGKNYFRLRLSGEDAVCFGSEVGFISKEREDTFAAFNEVTFNTNKDSIPHLSDLLESLYRSLGDTKKEDTKLLSDYMRGKANPSRERVAKIVDHFEGRGDVTTQTLVSYLSDLLEREYVFSEVTSVTTEDGVPTFDVCLPKTHSFWSNGLISHNTTLALETAVKCQEEGGSVCFLDYENAIAPEYARSLGLSFESDKFRLITPTTWEEGAEVINAMIDAEVDLIIVDSVSAMIPKANFEKDPNESDQIGLLARQMSRFLPNIVAQLRKSNTSLVYLNQLRSRIKMNKYDRGPDKTTSGGNALKYYCSLRVELERRKTEHDKIENELTGEKEKQAVCNLVKATGIKNKISPHQGHSTYFAIRYGEGIDNIRTILDIAENRGVIRRAGPWYKFTDAEGNEEKAQGKENLRKHFANNEDDFKAVVGQLSTFSSSGIGGGGGTPSNNDEDEEESEDSEE